MSAPLPVRPHRLTSLLVVLALVGAPALLLRAFCMGKSCDDGILAASAVPFCPLPADFRSLIVAGFRKERSPDVMAAPVSTPVRTPLSGADVPWPAANGIPAVRVPIAFFGREVVHRALADGAGLDQIAPTLASLLGFQRPHPDVRAGTSLGPLTAAGTPHTPLIVEIVWSGVGSADLEAHDAAWPFLRSMMRAGTGGLSGSTRSLPVDPAASLTTIGTGGLPYQHGITGTLIRNDAGGVVPAWTRRAPSSVISTLPDDLDHALDGAADIGAVITGPTDRGLIGDGWYLGADRDQVLIAPHDPIGAVNDLLTRGYGTDGAAGMIGVVERDTVRAMDRQTEGIVDAVRSNVPGAVFVVTATGSLRAAGNAVPVAAVTRNVNRAAGAPIVADPVAGGLFLDPTALASAGLSADTAVQAMRAMKAPEGTPLFADAYPSFSVAFSRYC